jgi:subtilisin family serine protease
MRVRKKLLIFLSALAIAGLVILLAGPQVPRVNEAVEKAADRSTHSFIVQGTDINQVARLVHEAGGSVTHWLKVINAVGANLTGAQLLRLEQAEGISRIYANRMVETTGSSTRGGAWDGGMPADIIDLPHGGEGHDPADGFYYSTDFVDGSGLEAYFPEMIGADELHAAGFTGNGITVAILDSGIWQHPNLIFNTSRRTRLVAGFDATLAADHWEQARIEGGETFELGDIDYPAGPFWGDFLDRCGHGTHLASIIGNTATSLAGNFQSVAPDVDIVVVRAFNEMGLASYIDVIVGLDWIVQNRERYGIDVVNCSFAATPLSYYWDDPINQAIMTAWSEGIVVVAAAGNCGPDAMTLGVPGNVPYVITVGAVSDNYTATNDSDEFLCSFSACGPTVEGFIKPEVVAPGGHILGLMPPHCWIATNYPEFAYEDGEYFQMSGTSQAAAVVSGLVALMLQNEPWLTPDDVKGKLMGNARPAVDGEGELAYSVFQQGAGMVYGPDTLYAPEYFAANTGLYVIADLEGTAHFGGMANMDEEGNYYVMNVDGTGYLWSDGYLWSSGYLWSDGYLWSSGYLWSDGGVFSNGYLWSDQYVFESGYLWSDGLSETTSLNSWVEQE